MNKPYQLDDRDLGIIKSLIEEYMERGRPVSSDCIARKPDCKLSSASVRAILARLEDFGLLQTVHTSSGRLPTPKGMHMYLDSLVRLKRPSRKVTMQLQDKLRTDSTDELAESAMESIADLTSMVALVSLPATIESRLASIQFVQLSSSRAMVVLVTQQGEVRNRLIEIDETVTARDLDVSAQLFNEWFAGRTMQQARIELGQRRSSLQLRIAELLQRMVETITTDADAQRKLLTSGYGNLSTSSSLLKNARLLQKLLGLLTRKDTLLQLLDKGVDSADVSVFIGSESGVPELSQSSVVVSPYRDGNGEIIGALGLIGPMRMRYSKVMPIVDVTTQLMGEALVRIHSDFN